MKRNSRSRRLGYRVAEAGRLVLGPEEDVAFVRWLFEAYAHTPTSLLKLVRPIKDRGVLPSRSGREAWCTRLPAMPEASGVASAPRAVGAPSAVLDATGEQGSASAPSGTQRHGPPSSVRALWG